ncbi:MAG: PIG-L family deacetylase [Planctomycetes bacterium]|nr:PIG-L family deacetylase [Planctomycetota bacterium]
MGMAVVEPLLMAASTAPEAAEGPSASSEPRSPLKVVCVGAHPDDPESGCGGTIARYAELGHHVTVI